MAIHLASTEVAYPLLEHDPRAFGLGLEQSHHHRGSTHQGAAA